MHLVWKDELGMLKRMGGFEGSEGSGFYWTGPEEVTILATVLADVALKLVLLFLPGEFCVAQLHGFVWSNTFLSSNSLTG